MSTPQRLFTSSLFLFLTELLACFVLTVQAHGYVNRIDIDSQQYRGNVPFGPTEPSIIHQVSTIDPVLGAYNSEINCGRGVERASLVASDVPAGARIEVHWTGGGGQLWPHNTGPVLTYLAKCDGECSSFDTTDARWFKINQIGWEDGKWFQQDFMDAHPHVFNLPENLAPGGYILRHEVIALHNAVGHGGAEFYPSCSNINVIGSGTGSPRESDLVSFPGAYDDDDPGIFIPTVYDGDQSDYPFPGPAIAAIASSSPSDEEEDNSDSDASGGISSTTSHVTSHTPMSTKSSSSLQPSGTSTPDSPSEPQSFQAICKLKLPPEFPNRKRHLFRRLSSWLFASHGLH